MNDSESYLNLPEVNDELENPWVLPTPTTIEKPWKLPRQLKNDANSQNFFSPLSARRRTVDRKSANSSSLLLHSLGTVSTVGRQSYNTSRARLNERSKTSALNTSNSERVLGVVNRMVDDINRRTLT